MQSLKLCIFFCALNEVMFILFTGYFSTIMKSLFFVSARLKWDKRSVMLQLF